MKKVIVCILITVLLCPLAFAETAEEYYNKGFTLFKQGEYNNAISEFNKALEVDPNHANALFGIGYASVQLKQFQQAEYYLKKSIEINPDNIYAYQGLGATYGTGSLDQPRESIFYYEKAIEIDPDFGDGYFGIAFAYQQLGQYQVAKDYHEKAIEAYNNKGNSHGAALAKRSIKILYDEGKL